MATLLAPLFNQRFYDANNVPLVGGKVFTYVAGTSTKTATFTDGTGLIQNQNPIILDARGECFMWFTPGQSYKIVLSPANDTDPPTAPIRTIDSVLTPATTLQLAKPVNDPMIGDGVTTAFALSANPGSVYNVSFNLGGVWQTPVADFSLSGLVITCTSPPPNLVSGFFSYTIALPIGTNDAALVNYSGQVAYPAGTVGRKLREYPSVSDFGAVGNGTTDDTAAFILAQAAAPFVRVPNNFVCKVAAGLNYWKFFGEGKVFEPGIQWDVSRTPQTGAIAKLYKPRTFGTYEQATGMSVTINSGQGQTRNNTQVLGAGTQGMAQSYVSRDHVAFYIGSSSFDPILMDATTNYTATTLVNSTVSALYAAGSLLAGMIIDTAHAIPFTGRIQSVAGTVITVDAWYPATPGGAGSGTPANNFGATINPNSKIWCQNSLLFVNGNSTNNQAKKGSGYELGLFVGAGGTGAGVWGFDCQSQAGKPEALHMARGGPRLFSYLNLAGADYGYRSESATRGFSSNNETYPFEAITAGVGVWNVNNDGGTISAGVRRGGIVPTAASTVFVNVDTVNPVGYGGLYWISGFNIVGGAEFHSLVMTRSGVVTIISNSDNTGLGITYQVSGRRLQIKCTTAGNIQFIGHSFTA